MALSNAKLLTLLQGVGKDIIVQVAPAAGNPAMKVLVPANSNAGGLAPTGSRWTEWRFINSVDGAKNANIWRVNATYEDTQAGADALTATYNRGQQLTRMGEFETAIQQDGYADFSGGVAHGNHLKTGVTAYRDGLTFDPTGTVNFSCRQMRLVQTSELFEFGNSGHKIAELLTEWVFDWAGLTLTQTLTIKDSITLSIIYLGAMPVFRNNGSINLVTIARRSPLYTDEDVSTSGKPEVITQAADLVGVNADNGYVFQATKLAGYDDATAPDRETRVAPAVDNKFYFNQINDGSPVAYVNGNVIGPVTTRYRITNPN